jgi:hypothetical protein
MMVVLPCSCLEQGSSVLAEDLTLGLKRDHVDLPVLVDNVDGGAGDIGKVDDLLGTHVPSHFDAFGLELSGKDDGSTQLHVELSGEFLASFIVDHCPYFRWVIDQILMIDHRRSCCKRDWGCGSCTTSGSAASRSASWEVLDLSRKGRVGSGEGGVFSFQGRNSCGKSIVASL